MRSSTSPVFPFVSQEAPRLLPRVVRIVIDMSRPSNEPDRYIARPLDESDWFVWDTRQSKPVFGTDTLGEHQARVAARRLSQVYRRATSPVDMPGAYETTGP